MHRASRGALSGLIKRAGLEQYWMTLSILAHMLPKASSLPSSSGAS